MDDPKNNKGIGCAFNRTVKRIGRIIPTAVNVVYNGFAIAKSLVFASLKNRSLEATSFTPNGDTVFYRCKRLDIETIRQEVIESRPRIRGPIDIIVDGHDEMFYGDHTIEGVVGTKPRDGTCWAFKFLVVKVLGGPVLDVLPMKDGSTIKSTIKALEELRRRYEIRRVYMDGEFYAIDILHYLTEHGIHYAVRGKIPPSLWKDHIPYETPLEHFLQRRNPDGSILHVVFCLYKYKSEIDNSDYCIVTDRPCDPKELRINYTRRWDIESGIRDLNQLEIKTTTRNPVLRFLFYAVAAIIYNFWVVVRKDIGIRLYGLRELLLSIVGFVQTVQMVICGRKIRLKLHPS
jgi:putative transposase